MDDINECQFVKTYMVVILQIIFLIYKGSYANENLD